MDTAVWTGVIGVLLTFAALGWAVHRDQKKDREQRQQEVEAMVNAKMQPIKETVERFAKHHAEHFEAIHELQAEQRTQSQRIADHKEEDTRQFGEIREMFREIRDALRDRK